MCRWFIFYCFICHCYVTPFCDATVTLKQGKVEGTLNKKDGYWSYFGIPYASVVGRYQGPGEPPTWNGTLKADRRTIQCKQYDTATNSVIGVEDCLTLNIYTPEVITKPLPVIVFVFGGGLYKGSNTDDRYNAKYLVKKEVIVVTVNYRVGALGFLCLKTKDAPGNVGVKDQVASLKWVRDNIAAFGGNPNSVTLQGESVGGSSVSLFILAQKAQGLFHRAIIDSGNVLRPLFFNREPMKAAADVATHLGYNTTDPDELYEIFNNASVDDIVIASARNSTNNSFEKFIFAVCVEEESEAAILTEYPKDLIQRVKDISDISIIMGFDSQEGIMWASDYNPEGLENLGRDFTSVVPKNFVFKKDEYRTLFMDDVMEFYFNNSAVTFPELINYFSDALVHYPSILVMEALISNPRISLYNYFFNYDSYRNKHKLASSLAWVPGASHCDGLYYLYDPVEYRETDPTPEDSRMIEIMTSFWTTFAKTGTPDTDCFDENITWERSKDSLQFLRFDKKIEMIGIPNPGRIAFWRRAQEKYGFSYL